MTATIIATPEPAATPPRVRLNITSNQPTIVVYRVDQDGTRTPVRTYDGGPLPVISGAAVIYDPEMSFGEPVSYTADGTGVTGSSTVTVDSDKVWLIHPNAPSRSMPVTLAGISDRAAAADQSVRYPLGRYYPIVANDGVRKADTYMLSVRTTGPQELAALKAITADLATLLLNVPPAKQWIDLGTEYISVGDTSRANPTGFAAFTRREWKLPCSVSGRPAGGSQAFNSYGASKALYPTYADRKAAAATYGQAFATT